MTTFVNLRLTIEQAAAVSRACEMMTRIGIGQIEYLAEELRWGALLPYTTAPDPDVAFNADRCDRVSDLCNAIKHEIGFARNASRGIGHQHNPMPVRRAYEVQKVIDKALAEHRNPNPEFRGVHYDGLGPRYTTDPAPEAVVDGSLALPASAIEGGTEP